MTGSILWIPNSIGTPAFVLDASVAIAWLIIEKSTPYTDSVVRKLSSTVGIVPAIWGTQIADMARRAERRHLVTQRELERYFGWLRNYWIRIDDETNALAWSDTHEIARKYRVTNFDAAYLELALRLKLPLATTDAALSRSALSAGVPIYSP
jgi:predicted nucleic acid-binding protein